jgi:Tol biopolymer transport system component
MQKFILLLAGFGLLGMIGCSSDTGNTETNTPPAQYTIEQFIDNIKVYGGSISPDNQQVLVSSNESGIFNAFTIPFEGGEMNQLTQSDSSSIFTISFFPNDQRILFRADDNGNELFHIFVRDEEGTVTELTPNKEARAVFYGWAHDGNSFFYGYNERDPKYMDVFEMDVATFKTRLIYPNSGGYDFGGISPDKQYMMLTKTINTDDSDLFLYDLNTSKMTKLSETQAAHSPQDFAPDGKSLYYTTNAGSEFNYLMKYNMEDGSREKILEKDWEVWYAYFSHGGKYRVVGVNEDGKTVVSVTDTQTGEPVSFPDLGNITSVSISRDEKVATFYVGTSTSPSNLYSFNFESGEHKQLTDVLNPGYQSKRSGTSRSGSLSFIR